KLPVPRISADDAPTCTSYAPASTTNLCAFASQYATSFSRTCSVTVLLAPLGTFTRAKSHNCLIGRVTVEFALLTYTCTTSSPSRSPVFFTSTVTATVPSRLLPAAPGATFKLLYPNVV